ncbi:MAG: hypothetical protein R2860_02090 [Desulfobacterales bacterium]
MLETIELIPSDPNGWRLLAENDAEFQGCERSGIQPLKKEFLLPMALGNITDFGVIKLAA